MEYVEHRFTLDVQKAVSQICIPVKLCDTARKLYITLADGSLPYHVGDSCKALLYATNAVGDTYIGDCVISDDTIIYTFESAISAVLGVVECDIRIYGGDLLLTTPSFLLKVGKRNEEGDEVEADVKSVIDIIYGDITNLKTASALPIYDSDKRTLTFSALNGDYFKIGFANAKHYSSYNEIPYEKSVDQGGGSVLLTNGTIRTPCGSGGGSSSDTGGTLGVSNVTFKNGILTVDKNDGTTVNYMLDTCNCNTYIYDVSLDSETNELVFLGVKDGFLTENRFVIGGGSSVEIVQETGESETAVMSQKSVTNAIPKIYDWAKASTKPTYTASEVGAATPDDVTSAFNSVRASAVGIPTYDASTGIMSFKTLDDGTTKTIDLPIEKIVDNVTLSADGKSFVFTFHNSDPITLPVDNITLPAWVTTEEFETATGDKLLIPPNTEAVRNYIIAKINSEATARTNADTALGSRIDDEATARENADKALDERVTALENNGGGSGEGSGVSDEALAEVKEIAEDAQTKANLAIVNGVSVPYVEGSDLVFTDFYGSESGRVTLPSGGGDSCACYDVPLQEFEYSNEDPWSDLIYNFNYTQVSDNYLKAYIHIGAAEVFYCGGYPSLYLVSNNPFGEDSASNIFYKTTDSGLYMYLNRDKPGEINIENEYFGTIENWFLEITAKIDTKELFVILTKLDAQY